VENYFTDALPYQEVGKTSKESMPDDDDNGNEADSEFKTDMPVTLVDEPVITCFNNLQCNAPSEDEDEWVINDNISFDYPVSVELLESVKDNSLHMPLHKLSASSTPVEFIEGSVLVVPPSKEGQLLIVFGKAQLQRSAAADSSSDSDSPQFFHYVQPTHHMMKKMGYNLKHRKGLNFGKGIRGLLRNFMPRGKPTNYYDYICRGMGYVTPTPPAMVQPEDNKSILSHSTSSSEWDSDVSVRTVFKELTINMTSSN